MYIEKLRLINFRNYLSEEIKFSNKVNLILGDNAQGKTNILEAVYICAVGKSHRLAKDEDMVFFGKDEYFIEIDLIKSNRSYKIEIGFNNKKGKKIKAGGTDLKKIGDLIGKLVIVMFVPDDLKIVKESPLHRRKFLDIFICQLHKAYLFDLQQYYKVLNQRNYLLKQIKINSDLKDTIDIWEEKLQEIGSRIVQKRLLFVKKINKAANDIHSELTSDKERLDVSYKSSFMQEKIDIDYKNIKQKFNEVLKRNREIDLKRGFTSAGPHRDDLEILINNLQIEKFGSQGQQRTAVLSLKLAELKILQEEIKESPILLLDDVFSELDKERKEILKKYAKDVQVLITSADGIKEFGESKEIQIFTVKNGKID